MKTFRAISTVALAILILVSSTSFVIGMHFCMGEVQDVAFFARAEGCVMDKELPACHQPAKKQCCDDETVVHKGDDFKVSPVVISHAGSSFEVVAPSLIAISEIIPERPLPHAEYYNYDPPLRSPDLTVRHQVFLI